MFLKIGFIWICIIYFDLIDVIDWRMPIFLFRLPEMPWDGGEYFLKLRFSVTSETRIDWTWLFLYQIFLCMLNLMVEFKQDYPNTPTKVRFVLNNFHPNDHKFHTFLQIKIDYSWCWLDSIWWCKKNEICPSWF